MEYRFSPRSDGPEAKATHGAPKIPRSRQRLEFVFRGFFAPDCQRESRYGVDRLRQAAAERHSWAFQQQVL